MVETIRVNGQDEVEFLQRLKARAGSVNEEVAGRVAEILKDVRLRGDEAVRE